MRDIIVIIVLRILHKTQVPSCGRRGPNNRRIVVLGINLDRATQYQLRNWSK
jgi:hypothetical protein